MAITIADNQGNAIDQNNPLPVDLTTSEAIIPVDVQNHLTQSITALNAVALTVSGGATPTSTSSAITCDGFNEISIIQSSSVSHNGSFQIWWSFDNSTFTLGESPSGDRIQNNGTFGTRFATMPVRAPYCKIGITNADGTATPTVTANVYLKA
jgi:hypothetical protein